MNLSQNAGPEKNSLKFCPLESDQSNGNIVILTCFQSLAPLSVMRKIVFMSINGKRK